MRIAKSFRVVLYIVPGAVVAGALVHQTHDAIGAWSALFLLLALPPFSLVFSMPVDIVDLWLRRRTRDPSWLQSFEGKRWQESPEGKRWLAANLPDEH